MLSKLKEYNAAIEVFLNDFFDRPSRADLLETISHLKTMADLRDSRIYDLMKKHGAVIAELKKAKAALTPIEDQLRETLAANAKLQDTKEDAEYKRDSALRDLDSYRNRTAARIWSLLKGL